MTYREAIQKGLEERKLTKAQLARNLEMSPQLLNDKLNKTKTMTADVLIEMMNAMGYDVVIKDRINGAEEVLGR